MARFRWDFFKGIRPRLSPRLLPQGEAVIARDVRLSDGAIDVWRDLLEEQQVSPITETIHRMRNNGNPFWLTWTSDVDVAKGPVADDELERTYFTGDGVPKITHLGIAPASKPLGVPAPIEAPSITGEALPDDTPVGTVTGISTPLLKADVVTPFASGNYPHSTAPSEHAWVHTGAGEAYATAGEQFSYTFNLPVGTRLRVAEIVDENTVVVEDSAGAEFIARSTQQTYDANVNLWRTLNTANTEAGAMRFYIPSGVRLTVTGHELQAGDVFRVTSIASPVTVSFLGGGLATPGVGRRVYGAEAGQSNASAEVRTWPNRSSHAKDGQFWVSDSDGTSAPGWAFVDIWVDDDGATSSGTHTFSGGFNFELIERDGTPYQDILDRVENRVYVYTYVTDLGEEGPPSPPSNIALLPLGGQVDVSDFAEAPEGLGIENIRIYRANTGFQVTEFQFVDEIGIEDGYYEDVVPATELGEVLQTASWDPPPEDLEGLITLPNGSLAGFVGKTVYLSEPYFPHAWPPEYKIPVDYDVVGLGAMANGVAALTVGTPYMLTGDHPRAMSKTQFEWQSCSSKRSIAQTLDSIIYGSPDGLVTMGPGGFKIATERHFTKKEWNELLNPKALQGFFHDGKYLGFHETGGFVFDPNDDAVGFTTLSLSNLATGYVDPEEDELYLVPGFSADETPYIVEKFTSSTTWQRPEDVTVGDVLVVAGGGGGGTGTWGGGGAGGVVFAENRLFATTEAVSVGTGAVGGSTGSNGSASSFGSITAVGGGGGGSVGSESLGFAGGSGGGGGGPSGPGTFPGGTGTEGQGFAGGSGFGSGSSNLRSSGGGGGAGAPGGNASSGAAGNGGTGVYFGYMFGDDLGEVGWVGGGGGGHCTTIGGQGGQGGGGDSTRGGMPNTGGGGGTGPLLSFTSGGSGVVALRYVDPEVESFIYKWDAAAGVFGDPLWASPTNVCPYPLNLSVARVISEDDEEYSVATIRLSHKGTVFAEKDIDSDDEFRLPDGFLIDTFTVEIAPRGRVDMIDIAESMNEIRQG